MGKHSNQRRFYKCPGCAKRRVTERKQTTAAALLSGYFECDCCGWSCRDNGKDPGMDELYAGDPVLVVEQLRKLLSQPSVRLRLPAVAWARISRLLALPYGQEPNPR